MSSHYSHRMMRASSDGSAHGPEDSAIQRAILAACIESTVPVTVQLLAARFRLPSHVVRGCVDALLAAGLLKAMTRHCGKDRFDILAPTSTGRIAIKDQGLS